MDSKAAAVSNLDPFWKSVIVSVALSQVVLLAVGLWLANDLYGWARWSADGTPPLHSYFATATGLHVLLVVIAWGLLSVALVIGGFVKSRVDR